MHEDVTDEFRALFRSLVVAYQPRGLDRDALPVYYAFLRKLAPEDVAAGAERVRETLKYFPTAGEWFQAAREAELARRRAQTVTERPQPAEDELSHEEAARRLRELAERFRGRVGPRGMPRLSKARLEQLRQQDRGTEEPRS